MSTEFPTLAEVMIRHRYWYAAMCCDCTKGDADTETIDREQHAAHVEQVWREACTIRTVEQLDALPDFAIVGVRMPAAQPSERNAHLFAIERDGGWFAVGSGDELNRDETEATMEVTTALLLWHPDWSKS